jgi:hypothetical protein
VLLLRRQSQHLPPAPPCACGMASAWMQRVPTPMKVRAVVFNLHPAVFLQVFLARLGHTQYPDCECTSGPCSREPDSAELGFLDQDPLSHWGGSVCLHDLSWYLCRRLLNAAGGMCLGCIGNPGVSCADSYFCVTFRLQRKPDTEDDALPEPCHV